MTDSTPESESDPTATRREAMAGGFALLLGIDFFGDEEDTPVQLTENGQAIIDLDDISELELGNGLDAEKASGTVTVSAQEVEDALLTILDSGSEANTTVDEVNFGSGLDVTSPSSNRVDVAASGGGGGATQVASGSETASSGTAVGVPFSNLSGVDETQPHVAVIGSVEFTGSSAGQVDVDVASVFDYGGKAVEITFSGIDGETTANWELYEL